MKLVGKKSSYFRMLVLLLLPSVLTLKQGGTTPASPTDSFEGIEDPDAQCIDILCYEPIMWSVDTEEVCRFRKDKKCEEKCEPVLDNTLMIDLLNLTLVHGAGMH